MWRVTSRFSPNIRVSNRFLSVSNKSIGTPSVFRFYSSIPEEKYSKKLLGEAQKQGFNSVEELKNHLKETIKYKKLEFNKIDPLKELEEYQQRTQMANNNSKNMMTKPRSPLDPNAPKVPFKTLNSFLNVAKIKDLSKQEVEFLWRARWAQKDNALSAVIPVGIYDKMMANARNNPIFVLPLPRQIQSEDTKPNEDQGMELHYIQWHFVGPQTTHCMMTSLAEYKLHQEFARPHTTLQFHSDLVKDKGIVCMNGHVESDTNVSVQDAHLLLLNIQRFYGAMGEDTPVAKQRVQLLRDFSKGSPQFTVEKLISLSQSMEN
ncbi:atp11p [Saccharomyces arboricola H-6]|uniref:Atp11p n=1 Tax=Saccharomyces arboricola (strain H-6 / AS 2.3317 / CBS 10644) TaxID=1160507 RepID=J8LJ95_SACAR|nr:atp11p [Saccharomyces arboricola H-6]